MQMQGVDSYIFDRINIESVNGQTTIETTPIFKDRRINDLDNSTKRYLSQEKLQQRQKSTSKGRKRT